MPHRKGMVDGSLWDMDTRLAITIESASIHSSRPSTFCVVISHAIDPERRRMVGRNGPGKADGNHASVLAILECGVRPNTEQPFVDDGPSDRLVSVFGENPRV